MTLGVLIARNHNALAKACLGGGFCFGFAYTNNHGTSPLRDAASAAGTSRVSRRRLRLRVDARLLHAYPFDIVERRSR